MRGGSVRTAWVVLAAVTMVTVPMVTAAPATVEEPEPVLPDPLAAEPAHDGPELARELLGSVPQDPAEDGVEVQRRNLALAEDLLALNTDPDSAPLERAVRQAQRASLWQAATVGASTDEAPMLEERSPSRAVGELVSRYDAELSVDQQRRVQALDALEDPLRGALADVVEAFLALQAATAEATPDPGADTTGDPGPVLAARGHFLDAVVSLHAAADAAGPKAAAQAPDLVVPPAFALDLDPGQDNRYTENVALSIDVGGDDTYHNNAGGTDVFDACSTDSHPELPSSGGPVPGAAALVDLSGADTYGNPDAPKDCGVNGGAWVGGTGVLVDAAGDDRYTAGDRAVNGGVVHGGVGLVLDAGGHDTYEAGLYGVNGASSRAYQVDRYPGLAALVDTGGDDTYEGEGPGVNGGARNSLHLPPYWTRLSVGFLFDGAGDDEYRAFRAHASNGGAHRVAVGFLLDARGEDLYRGGGRGGNGGSGLAGVGFLHDAGGDDIYEGSYAGVNGGSRGPGVGLLLDEGGDDAYEVLRSKGVNGGSCGGGSGFLVDTGGSDAYRANLHHESDEAIGVNGGASGCLLTPDGPGLTGLLFDAGGTDHYEDADQDATDRTVVPKGTLGAQVDWPHQPS